MSVTTPNGRQIKLCLVGESNVGKTCLANRFVSGNFMEPSAATIGGAFMSTPVDYQGTSYVLAIWDTAGSEKYRSIVPMFYRGAVAAVIVYDTTNIESFKQVDSWLKDMNSREPGIKHIVLCGNKDDREGERAVTTLDGRRKAQEINAAFFEASALTNHNVNEIFRDVVRQVHWQGQHPRTSVRSSSPPSPPPESPTIRIAQEPQKKGMKKDCCLK